MQLFLFFGDLYIPVWFSSLIFGIETNSNRFPDGIVGACYTMIVTMIYNKCIEK